TVQVAIINSSYLGASADPTDLVNFKGNLYFFATDGSDGTQLWTTDGTSTGTVIVTDVNTGGSGLILKQLTNVSGKVYFAANDGSDGYQLWDSSGTSANMLTSINDAGGGLNPDL